MLLSEADSSWVSTEADSGITRGRPPVFSDEALDQAAGYSYARRVRTRRGAQDLVYRMFAIAALEHFCEAYPEKEATLAWLLRPKRRHALLTELGRVAQPRSDAHGGLSWSEADVSRLIATALRWPTNARRRRRESRRSATFAVTIGLSRGLKAWNARNRVRVAGSLRSLPRLAARSGMRPMPPCHTRPTP